MKPVCLTIAGLNSFEEAQTIHFDRLTADGLFGIFGPTGSGKSTVIDAITLALYGETSRFQKEKRKEWINQNSVEMSVSFTFELGGCDGIYVAERRYKRVEDKAHADTARLYRVFGEVTDILADRPGTVSKTAAQIIGLSYEDFTRSVLLPQGRFSEFLLLENKERRLMLERIFRLETYGEALNERVRKETAAVREQLGLINNSIAIYEKDGELTAAVLKTERERLDGDRVALENLKVNLTRDKAIHTEWLAWQADTRLLEELQNQEQTLLLREPEMLAAGERLKQAENAARVKPYRQAVIETLRRLADHERCADGIRAEQALSRNTEAEARLVYEQAAKGKRDEYSVLLRKAEEGRQAIRVAEDMAETEKERQTLLAMYNEKQALQRQALARIGQSEEESARAEALLQEVITSKDASAVDPVFRQAVEAGLAAQRRWEDCAARVRQCAAKQEEWAEKKEKTAQTLAKLTAALAEAEAVCEASQKAWEALRNSGTFDTGTLLQKREAWQTQRQRVQTLEELQVRIKTAEAEETAARHILIQATKAYEQAKDAFLQAEAAFATARAAWDSARFRHDFAAVAGALQTGQPCPLCGALSHPNPAPPIPEAEWAGHKEQYETGAQALAEADEARRTADTQRQLAEAAARRALEALTTARDAAGTFDWQIETALEESLHQALTAYEQAYAAYEQQKTALDITRNDAAEQRQSILIQRAAAVESSGQAISQYEVSVREYETTAADEIRQQALLEDCVRAAGTDDFAGWRKTIETADRKRPLWEAQEAETRRVLTDARTRKDEAVSVLTRVEGELAGIKAQGQEKKALLQKRQTEARTLLKIDEDNTSEWTAEDWHNRADQQRQVAEESAERLTRAEETAVMTLQQAAERRQVASQKWETWLENRDTLTGILQEQQTTQQSALHENGFSTPDEASQAVLTAEEEERLSQSVENHKARWAYLRRDKAQVTERLVGVDTVDLDARIEACTEKIRSMEAESDRINTQITLGQERLTAMESGYAAVKTLKQERTHLTGQFDVLNELSDLLRGNAFVEYMATGHLRYITAEASVRLKRMTAGRYALELDGPDFVMRDDYNGGLRRSPRTLSGGETFMAALCLSLALSSNIQMKNHTMLDFFFLDEGFGTLDPAALDTVMLALEQLPRENMTVGVISHVEEMKNRIPRKLVVDPPQPGLHGTRVREE